jgi:phage-related minor tail protein
MLIKQDKGIGSLTAKKKETVMRANGRIASMIAVVVGNAYPAFAASGAREDSSGLAVWIFLGFCALIVLAQLVPAVLMMLGLVKGVAESREEPVKQSVE